MKQKKTRLQTQVYLNAFRFLIASKASKHSIETPKERLREVRERIDGRS